MYAVSLVKQARKTLFKMSRTDRQRIADKLTQLAADPDASGLDVRPLEGMDGELRLRVGDWRVRFRRDDAARILIVKAIAPRGGAYQP